MQTQWLHMHVQTNCTCNENIQLNNGILLPLHFTYLGKIIPLFTSVVFPALLLD